MVQVPPPQPTVRTEKDIGSENPETTTVSGFFYVIFQGGIQKISFPKNDHWGGLELNTLFFGGGFCDFFFAESVLFLFPLYITQCTKKGFYNKCWGQAMSLAPTFIMEPEFHLEKWHEKTQKPLWFLGFPNRYFFRFATLVAEAGLELNT